MKDIDLVYIFPSSEVKAKYFLASLRLLTKVGVRDGWLRKVSGLTASFDIILCDMLPNLTRAWQRAFATYPEVGVQRGDLLEVEADAYVSPANSYGIMDGGIDAVLCARFPYVEGRVQAAIAQIGRLLPVGRALVVETGDDYVPYLVCAPTMELPSRVAHTSNAYHAMLAVLTAVEQFNTENKDAISSIAIPGLCTGVGAMDPEIAAKQMAQAYSEWRANENEL